MKKKYDISIVIGLLIWVILAITLFWLFFFYQPKKEENINTPVEYTIHNTITGYVQAQKNELRTVKATATDRYTVADKKPVRTSKNGLKKNVPRVCPECGAPAEPNSLCAHCGEPFTRLWGYGFVRCWKTADGIEWETETAPACGCTPDETCDFCHDKINHGWKSSGELKYYEYSDFLKEKGLPMYEAVHPDEPVKKCKKQAVKKMEETVKVQEVNDVQDDNGQSVQQPTGSEEETGGEAGELENVDNYNNNDNGCRTVDNMDDVNMVENSQED